MKKKWKIILGAVAAIAILGFIFIQMREDVHVFVQILEPRDFSRGFKEEGVVKAGEQGIYPPFNTRIEKLLVQEGDMVETGQLVAVLDHKEVDHQLAEAAARLQGAAIELEQAQERQLAAEKNHGRSLTLYEANLVAEVELEEAEKALAEARAGVGILETHKQILAAQLRQLEDKREKHHLYAPLAGIVTQLQAREQDLANPQTPLLTILHGKGLEIETRLLTADMHDVYVGMQVNLAFKRREEELHFAGQVAAIAPYAEAAFSPLGLEEERVPITITPQIPTEITIGPGYKVDVEFSTETLPAVLVVPKTALFTHGNRDALFVIEEGRAQVRQVITGPATKWEVVITEGVEPGKIVIIEPRQKDLREGVAVSYEISSIPGGEQ